jgi:hypothetical protein
MGTSKFLFWHKTNKYNLKTYSTAHLRWLQVVVARVRQSLFNQIESSNYNMKMIYFKSDKTCSLQIGFSGNLNLVLGIITMTIGGVIMMIIMYG